jgi:hypothetical protein
LSWRHAESQQAASRAEAGQVGNGWRHTLFHAPRQPMSLSDLWIESIQLGTSFLRKFRISRDRLDEACRDWEHLSLAGTAATA